MLKRSVLLFLLCFATVGVAADAGKLFIVMGGFNSCPRLSSDSLLPTGKTLIGLEEESSARIDKIFNASQIMKSSSADQKNTFILSCFTRLLVKGFLNNFYFRSFELGDASFDSHKSILIEQNELVEPLYLGQFFAEIVHYLKSSGKTPVVIGHSYGGFSALHMTEKLVSAGFHVGGLVTLDAVSPVRCKARDMILRLDKTLLGATTDCHGFPADSASLAAVGVLAQTERLDWWANRYQTEFRQLKGGLVRLPFKDSSLELSNARISVQAKNFFYQDNHSLMALDDAMWKSLREQHIFGESVQIGQ